MTWKWDQSAGELSRNGAFVSKGYAGRGKGINNPAAQGEVGIGPVPRGHWRIGEPYDSDNTGRYTLALVPQPGTDTLGRSQFRIHGDNSKLNQSASHGCIILPRVIRQRIWASGDHEIEVVA